MQRSTSTSPMCSLHIVMLLQLMCDSLVCMGFEVNSDLTRTDYSFSKLCTLVLTTCIYYNPSFIVAGGNLLQWLRGIKVDDVLLPRCYAG